MTNYSVVEAPNSRSFRFSGHETFTFRHAWLPKAYRLLEQDEAAFSDEDGAMVELGLGKNMVRSLRFWAEATGLARPVAGRGLVLTEFARAVFGPDGFDPYLEDVRTLWLLHWSLSARAEGALFAWRFLLNHWPFPELSRSEALVAFARESAKLGHTHSEITLSQHLDAFLHTYHSARSSKVGVEDSLDGPLVGLSLLQEIGERKADSGRWETVHVFRREPKSDVTPALFDYCLGDFWTRFRGGEDTLTLREVTLAPCSPGQVFKLPEDDVRSRLEAYSDSGAQRPYSYHPSAVQGLVSRRQEVPAVTLADIYEREPADA